MSKRYEFVMPASFDASARASRPSKKSLAATPATVPDQRVKSRTVRVETREAAATDVRARLDPDLEPGEVRRDERELRVGAPELPGFDGLRSAAAHAARALRRDGGSVAWQAGRVEEVRA